MCLESLSCHNFRSHRCFDVGFCSELNFIVGRNASGKTSILEAISFLSERNGFLQSDFSNLITYGESFSNLDFIANGASTINIEFKNNRKYYKINEKGTDFNVLCKYFKLLYFVPKMQFSFLSTVGRRSFFTKFVSQIFEKHEEKVLAYSKIMKERLKILEQNAGSKWLDGVEKQMVGLSSSVLKERHEAFVILQKIDTELDFALLDIAVGADEIALLLKENRMIDAKSKRTNFSCHRFDFLISQNGTNYDSMSNSEQKMAIIEAEISFAKAIFEKFGTKPILLIDELNGSFDSEKSIMVLNKLSSYFGQIFASAPSVVGLEKLETEYKMISLD